MQERRGIAAVQSYASNAAQIWRETGTGDVGIDGQLEFVNEEGFATGRSVALQVKAGPSFFKYRTEIGWKFYPDPKHRSYWEAFPLPVLLVLHNPDTKLSYWTDARQALRVPARDERTYIEVALANVLEQTDPHALFETAGVLEGPFIPNLADVLARLVATQSREARFPLTYFDLFVHGLTNISRCIYFGMDAVMNAVEFNLAAQDAEFGMGMGHDEHQFAFGFVKFLLVQNLAKIDYSDCLIDWVDREMQPHFVAPLTSRGRELVAAIHREEERLVASGALPDGGGYRVAQEGFFRMVPASYFPRFPRIRAFQEAYSRKPTTP